MNDDYWSALEYHADLRANPGNFTCKARYGCSFVDEDRHCGYATTRGWKYVFTASTHYADSATARLRRVEQMQAREVTRLEVAAGIDAISGIAAETRALRAAAQAPGVMRIR